MDVLSDPTLSVKRNGRGAHADAVGSCVRERPSVSHGVPRDAPNKVPVDFSSRARSATACETDAREAERFLQHLDPDATGFLFTSGDDDKARARARVKRGMSAPFHHRHGRVTDYGVQAWMQERQASGWNVGVTVQAMKGTKRRADDLAYVRAVFAEMDHGQPVSWPLEPSIISETSQDHFHVYFLVDPEAPMSEADFHGCMMCMVEVYGSDPSAKDTARTLRLPGSWNMKPGREPHHVRIIHESGARYSRDELVSAFPAPPRPKPTPNAPRPHLNGCAPPGLERFVGDDGPLKAISPDQYATWIVVGQALHHESNGGADGLVLWDQWSAGSDKWTAGVCAQRWKSFGRRKGVTGGTIHAVAVSNGWRKPARRRALADKGQRTPGARTPSNTKVAPRPIDLTATAEAEATPRPNKPVWPKCSENGKPCARSQENIRAYVEWRGVKLARNAFANRDEITIDGATHELSDAALRTLRLEADALGLAPPKDYFEDVCHDLAQRNSYNPVADYLSSLLWDGKPRLDRWLPSYTGAPDTELNRAFGSKTLLAAVRRVRQPGCKSDAVLTLEGPQGIGKSTAFRILAGDPWFTDNLSIDADAKLVIEQTTGSWFVEIAELSGIRRGEVEAIKAMISRQSGPRADGV